MWQFLVAYWPTLVTASHMILSVVATGHAVMYKRDARSTIAWVGLIWLAPFFGVLLYYSFGINRVRRRAQALENRGIWLRTHLVHVEPDEKLRAQQLFAEHHGLLGLAELIRRLTNRPLLPGNRITPLVNGDEAYPAMLAAIAAARRSITLASYIFDHDRVGQKFLAALRDAVGRGVEVRVLIDDVGARYSRPSMPRKLAEAGVTVSTFLPTFVPRLFHYANLRNHRKILVVDGHVGFTGGTNIREGHELGLDPRYPVRCLHFRLDGPVVAHLQEMFVTDWLFARGELLSGDLWFPELSNVGPVWCRGIAHGPDQDFEKMQFTMLGALAAAREHIDIVTPYFLPDVSLIKALVVAALRGVQVRIVLPERNNIRLVQWAGMALFWQLLEHGCQIYLSRPPFDHAKLLVVDRVWAVIGSTNWDARSLRLNFEFNVECYDPQLAETLVSGVEERIASARSVTFDEVESRSLPTRLRDGLARLFIPYL